MERDRAQLKSGCCKTCSDARNLNLILTSAPGRAGVVIADRSTGCQESWTRTEEVETVLRTLAEGEVPGCHADQRGSSIIRKPLRKTSTISILKIAKIVRNEEKRSEVSTYQTTADNVLALAVVHKGSIRKILQIDSP